VSERETTGHSGRRWAEAARDEVVEFAGKIAETVREPFLVLDPQLRVVFANPAFYECFAVDEAATEGRLVYELGNGGWDIPELRRLLEHVLPHDERFSDYRVEHEFEGIGRRVMVLNGRRLDHADLILLAIEDATDRDGAERRLRESERRLSEVLDQLPIGVGLFDAEGRFELKNPQLEGVMGDLIPSRHTAEGYRWEAVDAAGRAVAPDDYPGARALRGEDARAPVDFRRTDDGDQRWMRVTAAPLRRDGTVTGGVTVVQDVTEQIRAHNEVRALAERNREVLESISDAFYAVDRDWRFTYVNHQAEHWWGRPREELIGKVVWEEFPQAVGSEPHWAHLSAAAERRVVRVETLSPLLLRWIDISIYPAADGGLSVFFRDITDRKQAEAAVREGEERQRAILESALDYAIFTTDPEGRIETWSPGAEAVFGWTAAEAIGADLAMTFTPEDRAAGVPEQERAEAREKGWAPNVRWHLRKDGRRVFIEGVTRTLQGRGPEPHGYLKVGQDVTARRQSEERQKVLLAELQHRVRNILAMVRSIVRRTMETAGAGGDLAARLDGRIAALARTQTLLTRTAGAGVDLEQMVREELQAQQAEDSQVTVEGPPVELASKAAEVLTLAVHELATNATKYGAFAHAGAALDIAWRIEPREGGPDWLRLSWRERGVPLDRDAGRGEGFGMELIRRRVPYELGGEGRVELEQDGLDAEIGFPLVPGESILVTGSPKGLPQEEGGA
jgi:PAS domain S-box-containing protein